MQFLRQITNIFGHSSHRLRNRNPNSMDILNQPDDKPMPPPDRVDPYVRRTRFQRATILHGVDEPEAELDPLPLISDCQGEEKIALVLAKIKQSCHVFDFENPLSHVRSKEVKRAALTELIEYITDLQEDTPFDEFMYKEIPSMVAHNVFREFHPVERHEFDVEEDDPMLELAWPHFQLVYEMLLRFLDSPRFSVSMAKRSFDRDFIFNLLKLFNSEDPRERDYLKTILHRIYGKFLVHRSYIRKEINNIFLSYVFEGEDFNGISELLEILGSIINGFTIPLKKEHIVFMEKVLMPLYSCKNLQLYHSQLGYCILQFVQKDPSLGAVVINRILKYWPKTCSQKEMLYITELSDIISTLEISHLKDIVAPIFQKVSSCTLSHHFQVAEAALRFIKDEQNMSIIAHYAKELQPIILPQLYRVNNDHWHGTIKFLVRHITRDILAICNISQDDVKATADEAERNSREREVRHQEIFKRLEQLQL